MDVHVACMRQALGDPVVWPDRMCEFIPRNYLYEEARETLHNSKSPDSNFHQNVGWTSRGYAVYIPTHPPTLVGKANK